LYRWNRRLSTRRMVIAGRAGQPLWHYRPGRGSCVQRPEWLRNAVQAGYEQQRERALQLHRWGGRLRSRGGNAGHEGQPVWYFRGRGPCMQPAEWLRNGVRGGYHRQRDRALQLHRDWWGWYGSRFTDITGHEGQAVWRYRRGRGPVLHDRTGRKWTNIDWLRHGVQTGAGDPDQDLDHAPVRAESVHLWRGSDLYGGSRSCAPGWRNGFVHERQNGTGNGIVKWRHSHLCNLDAQGGHYVGHGGIRWRLELRRKQIETGEAGGGEINALACSELPLGDGRLSFRITQKMGAR